MEEKFSLIFRVLGQSTGHKNSKLASLHGANGGITPQTPIVHPELKLHSERQDPIAIYYYHKNHSAATPPS
jgi:hypothetical protein